MQITTQIEQFDTPLYLESGRVLNRFHLAYESYGRLNSKKDNAILICHALTGSAHAAGKYEGDAKAGWWDGMIGSGKAIDTDKYFVICINALASPFGSTSPLDIMDKKSGKEYRLKFPVIVISDVVNSQLKLLKKLGIERLHAVIGGSFGGMQALCYAIEHPKISDRVIILASSYATPPWAIAFNKIAIEGILNDPAFKNGEYDRESIKKEGLNGLALARMAGHISFLSPYSMDLKFGRNYVQTDGLYELKGRFEVDRYMEYNGYNFAKRFDPLCYLYTVKMMNIFDCRRHYDDLRDALLPIESNVTLISFSGDVLFPPYLMREIYDELCSIGKKDLVRYIEIDSNYGHDAFLVEIDKFNFYVKEAIDGKRT
ncbi:homoserine O-acetyltransferase [uncultured Campylobacter sp.]|uniref:homoserine O-acetyltransferase MetX n=1 Tax=uncultured Campylobacter sp. TaxID=218934 RepID=UPI002633AEA0|nr:homoserine O-acetyltransferase [uncultured Campylobacter sp.]